MAINKYEALVGKTWYPIMTKFFNSPEFLEIGKTLKGYKDKGLKVQPDFANVFSMLRKCPLDQVKVVILIEIGTNKADNDKIAEAIAQAIHEDTNASETNIWETDDCLLLPLNLTACNNENHTELWKPFIFHIMKSLQSKPGLIYCFIGKSARNHWLTVDKSCNDIYYIEHPFQALLNKRKWKYDSVFKKINNASIFLNEKSIF